MDSRAGAKAAEIESQTCPKAELSVLQTRTRVPPMENPWFGPKAYPGSTGIITWQGWVTVIAGVGGAIACHLILKNNWAAIGCIAVMLAICLAKYDRDTPSY